MISTPSNHASESAIIGCCLMGGLETVLQAQQLVPPSAFDDDRIRAGYECLGELAKRGGTIDLINLAAEWRSRFGSTSELPVEVTNAEHGIPSHHELPSYAKLVMDAKRRRNAMMAGNILTCGAADLRKDMDAVIADAESFLSNENIEANNFVAPQKLASDLQDHVEFRYNLQGKRSGINTGFLELDDKTDGLQAGEFWVIGARPGRGKTAMAVNIAEYVAVSKQIPVLFVTLEMSATAIARRMLSSMCEIPMNSIRRGLFSRDEFMRMSTFSVKLKNAPFHVLESPGGMKIGRLCMAIRSAVKRHGIKVVLIDYLQKIKADDRGEKRTYEIGDITSELVAVTKRENINLLALAQLNRECEHEKGRSPRVSDLADSKSIEADADFIGLIHRTADAPERAIFLIAKQRDGEIATIEFRFNGKFCKFENPTP